MYRPTELCLLKKKNTIYSMNISKGRRYIYIYIEREREGGGGGREREETLDILWYFPSYNIKHDSKFYFDE